MGEVPSLHCLACQAHHRSVQDPLVRQHRALMAGPNWRQCPLAIERRATECHEANRFVQNPPRFNPCECRAAHCPTTPPPRDHPHTMPGAPLLCTRKHHCEDCPDYRVHHPSAAKLAAVTPLFEGNTPPGCPMEAHWHNSADSFPDLEARQFDLTSPPPHPALVPASWCTIKMTDAQKQFHLATLTRPRTQHAATSSPSARHPTASASSAAGMDGRGT